MSSQQVTNADIPTLVQEWLSSDSERQNAIFNSLSNTKKKQFRTEVTRVRENEAENPAPNDEDEDIQMPVISSTVQKTQAGGMSSSSAGKTVSFNSDIKDSQMRQMWEFIESLDVSTMNQEDFQIFEYEGFNQDAVLRSLMQQKQRNNVSNTEFGKDISMLCALAVAKGSLNDHNIKKMKSAGQSAYNDLASKYGIKLGTARGQASDIVTLSRVAAAFPHVVVSLIFNRKVTARQFNGPMKSASLPSVFRHQAICSCIPRSDLPDDVKDFLLSAINGFAVDQSLTINPGKQKPSKEDAYNSQKNFTATAHAGNHPSEEVRKRIFRSLNLGSEYSALLRVVQEVRKLDEGVKVVEQATFTTAINSL